MYMRATYTCILVNHNGLMSKTIHCSIVYSLSHERMLILIFLNIYLKPISNYLNNKEL